MTGRAFHQVPVIDVGPVLDPEATEDEVAAVAAEVGAACRDVGFFYIVGHSLDDDFVARMFAQSKAFFDLPIEDKLAIRMGLTSQFRGYIPMLGETTDGRRDLHECVDLQPLSGRDEETIRAAKAARAGGHPLDDPGQWPPSLPTLGPVMVAAWTRLSHLGDRLASCVARSLGLDPDFFVPFTGDELCDLRLSHYPPAGSDPDQPDVDLGMGAHVDYGFLALVLQDGVAGLEVRNSLGEWIDAPHVPGTLLVNIGLMTQRWSNDCYEATWHRVRVPKAEHRYSILFFFEPAFDAVIAPAPECCVNEPAHYEPIQFGTWVVDRFSTAYDAQPVHDC